MFFPPWELLLTNMLTKDTQASFHGKAAEKLVEIFEALVAWMSSNLLRLNSVQHN